MTLQTLSSAAFLGSMLHSAASHTPWALMLGIIVYGLICLRHNQTLT